MIGKIPQLAVLRAGLAEAKAEVASALRGERWLIGRWEPSAWNRRAEHAAAEVFARRRGDARFPWRASIDFRGRLSYGADLIEAVQRLVMRGAIVHVDGVDGRMRIDRLAREERERREEEARARQRARFARLRGVEGKTVTADPPESCRLVISGRGPDGAMKIELRAEASPIARRKVRVARVLETAWSVAFWWATPDGEVRLYLVRDEADRLGLMAEDGRTFVG